MKRILAGLLLCGAASAQNSDLGLLLGVGSVRTTVVRTRTESQVSAHGQINYAAQLKEWPGARLYLELPLLMGGQVRSTVSRGVSASTGAIVYFTPGVRCNVPIHNRVSLYGTAGAGLAGFGGNRANVNNSGISASSGFEAALAGAAGAGMDFRLSRLMSLRFEARDFITRAGLTSSGHNHLVYGFGVGFHW
jgi:hypothetical protein